MDGGNQSEGMTVEEWREFELASDVRHEYVDGRVYEMARDSLALSRIGTNIAILLNDAFGDGPCIAYGSDMATRVSAYRYTYADVVVSCS
jgi:Uma2 family endonuclease